MRSLLPPAASDFELDVESVIISAFDGMPAAPFLDLWRAETCPAAFLAWLAWANSVDTWDNAWPDEIKRRTILAAGEVHKRKGTAAAVRGAVDALGAGINIIEWWQEEPPGTPRHFKVDVTPSPVITNDLNFQRALINAIERTKPLSTRYDLQLRIEVKGEQYQYAELRPVNYARLRAEEEGYVEPDPDPVTPPIIEVNRIPPSHEWMMIDGTVEITSGRGEADISVQADIIELNNLPTSTVTVFL